MAHYRQRSTTIEAWHVSSLHYDGGNDFWHLPTQIIAAYDRGEVLFLNHPARIEIKTRKGWETVAYADLIMEGLIPNLFLFGRTFLPQRTNTFIRRSAHLSIGISTSRKTERRHWLVEESMTNT